MVPVASIEHQLLGRVRLRVPSKRGDVPFFERVVRELSQHPSMRELTASSLTRSITLLYCEPLHPITTRCRGSEAVRDWSIRTTKRVETGLGVARTFRARRRSRRCTVRIGRASGGAGKRVGERGRKPMARIRRSANLWSAGHCSGVCCPGYLSGAKGPNLRCRLVSFLLRADPAPHCCHGTGKGAQLGFRSSPNRESRQQRQRFWGGNSRPRCRLPPRQGGQEVVSAPSAPKEGIAATQHGPPSPHGLTFAAGESGRRRLAHGSAWRLLPCRSFSRSAVRDVRYQR